MRRPRETPREIGIVARLLMAIVGAYRVIPKPGVPRCRFFPSCSAYALGALERHGARRGVALGLRRVARCHPFHPGGIDPVPEVSDSRTSRGGSRQEGAVA